MGKITKRLIAGGGLLAAGLLLGWLARNVAGFATFYTTNIYKILVEVIARITSLFPFSLLEFGLYGVVLGSIASVIWGIVQAVRKTDKPHRIFGRWISGVILMAGILFFVYTVGCGINYHSISFSQKEGLKVEKYTEEDLWNLCVKLIEEVNEAAALVEWTEDGYSVMPSDYEKEAISCMKKLGESYDSLSGFYPNPKEIAISRILTMMQVSGVYSPWSIEANFNGEMRAYQIPSTLCHELSHLKGFMREDEAEYLAYRACMLSEDPYFRYSGAMHAYATSINTYYRNFGWDNYDLVQSMIDARADNEWGEASDFWRKYEGKVSEVQEVVNDTYLQANGQSDGTKSYGRMVDLLIADMKKAEEGKN